MDKPEIPADTIPVGTVPNVDSSSAANTTMKLLQEQLALAHQARINAEQSAAETARQLKEIADKDLSDAERLKQENEELKPFKGAAEKMQTALQTLFDAELKAVPEDKRAAVMALCATGDLADRLAALQSAKALLGNSAPQPLGGAAPSTRQGASNGQPAVQAFDPLKMPGLGDYNWKIN